jgi:hypothetical protein
MEKRDPTLDTLLDLDGQVLVLDEEGEYWVKFEVKRVAVTPQRPHGLYHSLTLHGQENERLIGFDNAHATRQSAGPGGKARGTYDHRHRFHTIRQYQNRDAAALLTDFWIEVDTVLRERGVVK